MFDSYKSSVGERIRYYRKRAQMTQKQLAQSCQITEPAIRNYEPDNRTPDFDTLADIAEALHISYYTLADPILSDLTGVMHSLFRLEYAHGLCPVNLDGKTVLSLDLSYNHVNPSILQRILDQWLEARNKLDSGAWSLDQYEDWEAAFPFTDLPQKKMVTKNISDHESKNNSKSLIRKQCLGSPPRLFRTRKTCWDIPNP